jgi:hypothetical protein
MENVSPTESITSETVSNKAITCEQDPIITNPEPCFNFDIISAWLENHNYMNVKIHRRDNKRVSVNLDVYTCNNGGRHISATSEGSQFTYFNKSTTILEFKTDLKNFLPVLYEKINLAKECQYCEAVFLDEKNPNRVLCGNCIAWSCFSDVQTCIICQKAEYPTKFKCLTCTDSVVCIKCASHNLFKNRCPTCKKPEVKFGAKRVREENSDDERVEELSDSEDD